MKEKIIAANMIAIARNRKGDAKRSAMLRMIMPFLSHETGNKLAQVISDSDSAKFGKIWDGVKREVSKRLQQKRKVHKQVATAADMRVFQRDDESVINVDMYGSEKLRVTIEGVTVWDGQAPGYREMTDANYDSEQTIESRVAELNPPVLESTEDAVTPRANIAFDFGQTGNQYAITDGQTIELLHNVCLRLLNNEDPCPLEPVSPDEIKYDFNADLSLHELRGCFTAAAR